MCSKCCCVVCLLGVGELSRFFKDRYSRPWTRNKNDVSGDKVYFPPFEIHKISFHYLSELKFQPRTINIFFIEDAYKLYDSF